VVLNFIWACPQLTIKWNSSAGLRNAVSRSATSIKMIDANSSGHTQQNSFFIDKENKRLDGETFIINKHFTTWAIGRVTSGYTSSWHTMLDHEDATNRFFVANLFECIRDAKHSLPSIVGTPGVSKLFISRQVAKGYEKESFLFEFFLLLL